MNMRQGRLTPDSCHGPEEDYYTQGMKEEKCNKIGKGGYEFLDSNNVPIAGVQRQTRQRKQSLNSLISMRGYVIRRCAGRSTVHICKAPGQIRREECDSVRKTTTEI